MRRPARAVTIGLVLAVISVTAPTAAPALLASPPPPVPSASTVVHSPTNSAGRSGVVTAADQAKHPLTAAARKHAAHGRPAALQVQAAKAKKAGNAGAAVAGIAPAVVGKAAVAANRDFTAPAPNPPALRRQLAPAPGRSPAAASAAAATAAAPVLNPGGEPDYFGNTPNYATSQLPDGGADVTITDPAGSGTGATASTTVDGTGAVTGIVMSGGGSGYSSHPTVTVDGAGTGATAHAVVVGGVTDVAIVDRGSGYDSQSPPLVTFSAPTAAGGTQATGTVTAVDPATGAVSGINVDNAGSGYSSANPPTVTIAAPLPPSDPTVTVTPATATASVSGTVDSVVVDTPGSGYFLTGSGIRKFVDGLPGVGKANANDLGQYISQAHPDTTTFPGADYYEIGLVEVQRQLHKDLPATTLRLYVQLNKGTDPTVKNPTTTDNTVLPDGPQYMGPMIDAQSGKPVRVKFVNMLPKTQGTACADRSSGTIPLAGTFTSTAGTASTTWNYNNSDGCGNLFLPVDTNTMGAGMGPLGMNTGGKPMDYSQNRATIHLHGGKTPWISDGTPHQWITPTGENTAYPKGVSVTSVPDMWFDAAGNPSPTKDATHTSNDPGDGSETFYYTNQQSARMMFFHDHSFGITRLNVYAGEEAPYIIHDAAEKAFEMATTDLQDDSTTIPLVLQDKSFVPNDTQLAAQDPTWQKKQWGGQGQLWMPHVWMTNQNPTNDNGANPMGRWDYGPWFWPPYTGLQNPPVANPLYDPNCSTASNACENSTNPGWDKTNVDGTNGNVSQTMESFFDTMLVNGTAYPTKKVAQKVYRLRILNGSNDRHVNLSLFYAKSNGAMWTTDKNGKQVLNDANAGEVPMMDASPAAINDPGNGCSAAQKATWPHDGRDGGVPLCKAAGPDMIQVGNDGGFLPKPVTISAQPVDYEYNRRNIIVLDLLHHGLLLAPAERADVLVDFSHVPDGAKLILYNDAPAADPAVDPRNDYYTGNPDQTAGGGAPTTQPGYGPNTRTVMQFQVDSSLNGSTTSAGLDQTSLAANLAAAYQADQPAPIVPQIAYNGLSLPQGYSWTVDKTGAATPTAVGLSTIQTKTNNFTAIADTTKSFTPAGSTTPVTVNMQPKAIQELFDPVWGKMNATLGAELPNTSANTQTTLPLGYGEPATDILDPHQIGTQIGALGDGTQIWKITHNGVDSHPVHFHLFDVQLINRVGWDGAKYAPEPNELGWKDTVLMHPLEDTIVAMRPQLPVLPFKLPDSLRPIDPAMPLGSPINSFDAQTGQAITVPNSVQNYGWEYVWHCHMLSHEEMDFMRPMVVHGAPAVPTGLTAVPGATSVQLTWTGPTAKNPALSNYTLQRSTSPDFTTGVTSLADANSATALTAASWTDTITPSQNYFYRVRSESVSGYSPWSSTAIVLGAPSSVQVSSTSGRRGNTNVVSWAAPDTTGLPANTTVSTQVQRSTTPDFTNAASVMVAAGLNSWPDPTPATTTTYYQVRFVASTGGILSAWTTTFALFTGPINLRASATALVPGVKLTWDAALVTTPAVTGYEIQRSTSTAFTTTQSFTPPGTGTTFTDTTGNVGTTYYYRVRATYAGGTSLWSNAQSATVKALASPSRPSATTGKQADGQYVTTLTWTNGTTYDTVQVQRSTDNGATWTSTTLPGSTTSWTAPPALPGSTLVYRVSGSSGSSTSLPSATRTVTYAGTPLTPTFTLTPGIGSFTATITPGTGSTASIAPTSYTLTYWTGTGTHRSVNVTVVPGTTTVRTVSNLNGTTTYTVTVTANNGAGSSPATAQATVKTQ